MAKDRTQSAVKPVNVDRTARPGLVDTVRSGLSFVLRRGWNVVGLPVVILAMIAYFASQSPHFLSSGNFDNVARNLSAVALLAIGQGFVILLGHVDISVGANVGLTTVIVAEAVQRWGDVGFIAAPLTGALIGLVNGVIVARFRVHSVIVTIGTMTAVRGLAYVITSGEPVTGNFSNAFQWIGVGSIGAIPAPFVIAFAAFVLAALTLRYTVFGTELYATGGNEEAARLAGIGVDRVKIMAFVCTGALAGVAGLVLAARINSGQPNLGEGLELVSIAAAVVGGMSLTGGKGSMTGVALGVLVLTILQNGLDITNVSSYAQQVVSGLVILAAIIIDSFRSRPRVEASEPAPASGAAQPEPPPLMEGG